MCYNLGVNYDIHCSNFGALMKIARHIEKELLLWKNSTTRKPLILRGARQVGKTFIVEEFSKNFNHFISLNLERPRERKLFDNFNTGPELFERILFYKGIKADEKNTLLFIDEIQQSSEAIRSLRYFWEDMKYLRVLAAGSLLEVFSKKEGFSFPTGRVRNVFMYPVNFLEYLEHKNPPAAQKLLNLDLTVDTHLHDLLLEEFYEYAFVGGMPEALSLYLETNTYSQLSEVYDALIMGYMEDVEKYASQAKAGYLTHIIDYAPLYAGERITYEKFGESSYKSREMKNAFDTLEKALILYRARPSTSIQIPIIEKKQMAPKLFFLDAGLVNFRVGIREAFGGRSAKEMINGQYMGKIMEQLVAQELLSKTHRKSKLHFWIKSKGEAETDFLYSFNGLLIPIEVKSGKVGTLRSLFQFMERSSHSYALRVYSGENRIDPIRLPSGKEFYLQSIPFYLLPRLDAVLTQLILKYPSGPFGSRK
jgi:predicted AAA+ superfamily ATPase